MIDEKIKEAWLISQDFIYRDSLIRILADAFVQAEALARMAEHRILRLTDMFVGHEECKICKLSLADHVAEVEGELSK